MCQQRDDENDGKPPYDKLIPGSHVELGEIALEEAALKAGAPPFYTLLVGAHLRTAAVHLARKINAQQLNNPLAPYINAQVEERFIGNEWCLVTDKRAVGSTGVF